VISKQKLEAPLLTKYSIVNPMAPTTTALESRSYPALRRSTISQRNAPVLAMVPAPVTGQEARPPDLALIRGAVQTSHSAVRTPTYVLPNPLGTGYARITIQNYPRATDTDPTETDESAICNNAASARTAQAQAAQRPHAPRAMTQKETRKIQFLDQASADPASHTTIPVASPHKRAQGKRRKWMEPAPWMRFHPFVATLEQWAAGLSALCGEPWSQAAVRAAIERGPHTSALTPEARDLID
jgi:hypothetical protein